MTRNNNGIFSTCIKNKQQVSINKLSLARFTERGTSHFVSLKLISLSLVN